MHAYTLSDALNAPTTAVLAWLYLLTNSARLFTYLPQIRAVWVSHDGAQAISLLTWGSWIVSHLTALGYGCWILDDAFFAVVSTVNLVCTSAVFWIAWNRRVQWRMRQVPTLAAPPLGKRFY